MVKVLDCDLEVSEFERQFRCKVHFRSYAIGKGMKSLKSLAIG